MSKNNVGSVSRLSVRIHLVLGCTGICGNQLKTFLKNNEIGVQWHRSYELIMALTSANQCSSMITMTIIDDNVVRMRPSDLIGKDNGGTKGVRLGQIVFGEPVSDQ